MRAEHRPRSPLRVLQQCPGELVVLLVHVVLPRERDARRLVVRALHQPDRRPEREQGFQVGGRATQVGLEGHPDVVLLRPHPLEGVEGHVGVGRIFHVDPQRRMMLRGARYQRAQPRQAGRAVDVQPQLGQLHRDLARQPARLYLVEHAEVVVPHGVRLGTARDVFAQLGEERPDAARAELGGCRQSVGEFLARHEPAHRPADECAAPQLLRQPGAVRGAQQQAPGDGHAASPTASRCPARRPERSCPAPAAGTQASCPARRSDRRSSGSARPRVHR